MAVDQPSHDFDDDLADAAAAKASAARVLQRGLGRWPNPPPVADLALGAASIRNGVRRERDPYTTIAQAADFGDALPGDDQELWLRAAGALVEMPGDAPLSVAEEAAVLSLRPADWLGAVLELVRAGVGAVAAPPKLVDYIDACPELEGEVADADRALLQRAFQVVLAHWEAIGAVDAGQRLTPLGLWGLPRALALAWGHPPE